jgi:uncharacterized protein YlxP (DUF503 family)
MIIGILRLEITLHGNDSLKGKRNVARSLKQKLRNKFNLAVSEVASQESHVRLVLAAVTCGPDWGSVEKRLQNAQSMVEAISPEELTDSDIEIFKAD